jgi:hypothetical protein
MVPDTGGNPSVARAAQSLLLAVPEALKLPLVTPEVPEHFSLSEKVKTAAVAVPPKDTGGEMSSVPEVIEQLSGPDAAVVGRAPNADDGVTPTSMGTTTTATIVSSSVRRMGPPVADR